MDWTDHGTILSLRPHGETSAIIDVFTEGHGRHAGVVRGGASRRLTPHLQPGTDVSVAWRARLEEHIGAYTVEPQQSRAAVFADRVALAGLNAVTALLAFCLPEREPQPRLFVRSRRLLDALGGPDWGTGYLLWELALLEETGFGLDLGACAVTGVREGLVHVSPRTGRAVSAEGAGEWADRLLPLPPVLLGAAAGPGDLAAGLRVTGHFLARHLAADQGGRPLPAARDRLVALLLRPAADQSGAR